jgi:hypothetical protein
MKVLISGWEFPPQISGGLETSSYGLTKRLASFDDMSLLSLYYKIFSNKK